MLGTNQRNHSSRALTQLAYLYYKRMKFHLQTLITRSPSLNLGDCGIRLKCVILTEPSSDGAEADEQLFREDVQAVEEAEAGAGAAPLYEEVSSQ